mmetsp:Transcript_2594/g.11102  ORF Transcript_2594/g.11102 Transcript_2594/m.11102 type:complete len:84 (-) Transcript_2594:1891-2142(-)
MKMSSSCIHVTKQRAQRNRHDFEDESKGGSSSFYGIRCFEAICILQVVINTADIDLPKKSKHSGSWLNEALQSRKCCEEFFLL